MSTYYLRKQLENEQRYRELKARVLDAQRELERNYTEAPEVGPLSDTALIRLLLQLEDRITALEGERND